jgi:membrane-associated phospholipid phosphatase
MMRKVSLIILLLLPSGLFSQNLDIRLLGSMNSPETLPSDDFFRFVSNSEVYLVIGIPAGMAATGLIKDDRELVRNACVSLAAEAINAGITNLLKYTINRDRPFVTYPDITKKAPAGSPSFPSGHTSSAFATATSLTLAYPKWYIIVPSYAWAGTVGYSRMHLGVHYPSDVLAGAVIGAGSAYLTYKINQKLNPKRKIKPCNCPRF